MTLHIPRWLVVVLSLLLAAGVGAGAVLLLTDGDDGEGATVTTASATTDEDPVSGQSADLARADAICERILRPRARLSIRRLSLGGARNHALLLDQLDEVATDLEATSAGLRVFSDSAVRQVANAQEETATAARLFAASDDPGDQGAFDAGLDNLEFAAQRADLPNCYLR